MDGGSMHEKRDRCIYTRPRGVPEGMQKWIFNIRSRPFVLLLLASAAVTMLVYTGATAGFDSAVSAYFESATGGPSLDTLMWFATEIGHAHYMLVFAIVVILLKRTRRIGITLMILLVVTTLVTGYIKCGVDRDRPEADWEGPDFPVPLSRDTFALFCDGGLFASYPSGHAARTMAFAIVLGYALSQRFPHGCYLILLYPAAVSLSRVYTLEHYPMDVVGGTLIAALLAGALAQKTRLYSIFEPSKA